MNHVAAVAGAVLSWWVVGCAAAPEARESTERTSTASSEGSEETEALAVTPAALSLEKEAKVREATVSFVPATGCEGVTGTWRGQVYSEPHGGFYEVTAHIANGDRSTLEGSLLARSWQGSRDDVTPPETCDGSSFHWKVLEHAAGELHVDGSLSFAGLDWRLDEQLCGQDVSDYSPDVLELDAPTDRSATTRLTGRMSDGAAWKEGVPIELTRIACE